jgi:uncharacterized protein (DUF2336 family)
MPDGQGSLLDELDAVLQSGSSKKRIAMLQQVTDLFLSEADGLGEKHIGIFDCVLLQLIEGIEARTLAAISERLAPGTNAPIDLSLNLARHSDTEVAGPILTNSSRLTTAELVDLAKTKSRDHLLAISKRAHIETAVTDVVMTRGDQAVIHSVAGNPGAKFSEDGLAALLRATATDDKLALDYFGQRLSRGTKVAPFEEEPEMRAYIPATDQTRSGKVSALDLWGDQA